MHNSITRGLLKKAKTSVIFKTTNKRWFELSIPSNYFGYKKTEKSDKFNFKCELQEIVSYCPIIDPQFLKITKWQESFSVRTTTREFILFCESIHEKEKWSNIFSFVFLMREAANSLNSNPGYDDFFIEDKCHLNSKSDSSPSDFVGEEDESNMNQSKNKEVNDVEIVAMKRGDYGYSRDKYDTIERSGSMFWRVR